MIDECRSPLFFSEKAVQSFLYFSINILGGKNYWESSCTNTREYIELNSEKLYVV